MNMFNCLHAMICYTLALIGISILFRIGVLMQLRFDTSDYIAIGFLVVVTIVTLFVLHMKGKN